jgi:hypothetical protein
MVLTATSPLGLALLVLARRWRGCRSGFRLEIRMGKHPLMDSAQGSRVAASGITGVILRLGVLLAMMDPQPCGHPGLVGILPLEHVEVLVISNQPLQGAASGNLVPCQLLFDARPCHGRRPPFDNAASPVANQPVVTDGFENHPIGRWVRWRNLCDHHGCEVTIDYHDISRVMHTKDTELSHFTGSVAAQDVPRAAR